MFWGCFAKLSFFFALKNNDSKVKNVCGESLICVKCKCRTNACPGKDISGNLHKGLGILEPHWGELGSWATE